VTHTSRTMERFTERLFSSNGRRGKGFAPAFPMDRNQRSMFPAATELSDAQFNKVKDVVYRECGICLKSGKEALVKARLTKRLRALRMGTFGEYIDYLENEGGEMELSSMIDVITTNKTSFFREIDHFHFLRDTVLPKLQSRRIRFWSAGCSSGEEPFSLAMLLVRVSAGPWVKGCAHPRHGHFHPHARANQIRPLYSGETGITPQILYQSIFCQNAFGRARNLSIESGGQKNRQTRKTEPHGRLAHEGSL
jgi:hypothetical protein